jgi:hypothetical protein
MERRMKPQRESSEDLGFTAEVASQDHLVPLTPDQEAHLQTWDVKIDLWIEEIREAQEKQRKYKEYVSRTRDYKNYDRS